jgi:hypothetical protein
MLALARSIQADWRRDATSNNDRRGVGNNGRRDARVVTARRSIFVPRDRRLREGIQQVAVTSLYRRVGRNGNWISTTAHTSRCPLPAPSPTSPRSWPITQDRSCSVKRLRANVRSTDGHLRPLSRLYQLGSILANCFELEQVAWLAGTPPEVVSSTVTPVFAPWQGGVELPRATFVHVAPESTK